MAMQTIDRLPTELSVREISGTPYEAGREYDCRMEPIAGFLCQRIPGKA
jgi:hypothetical protein